MRLNKGALAVAIGGVIGVIFMRHLPHVLPVLRKPLPRDRPCEPSQIDMQQVAEGGCRRPQRHGN